MKTRTRLGVESLEAREVPANFWWAATDIMGTYQSLTANDGNGRAANLVTEDGGSIHPWLSDVNVATSTFFFNNNGNSNCQLSQQDIGGIVALNNYTGNIRSAASGLVLKGASSSGFNGLTNNKLDLELQGDMTVWDDICSFSNVNVTWGSPHNIVVNSGATLKLNDTVNSNENIVNYGELDFGDATASSTYNIINGNGDTLYIVNDTTGRFNWKGAQAGNASNPDLFYVRNKGVFDFQAQTGVGTLKGAYWNDYGTTEINDGQLVINGKKTAAGFADKSIISDHGFWDQYDKGAVKYSYDSVWNYTPFTLHHTSGGTYITYLNAYQNVATETFFYHCDLSLSGGYADRRGMTLWVGGNLDALKLRGCNVYETLYWDATVGSGVDLFHSDYTFDAGDGGGGQTARNSLYLSTTGTKKNGIWTFLESQSTFTGFWLYSVPTGSGMTYSDAVPNGRRLTITGGGGE